MQSAIKIENLFKEYKLGVLGRGTLYRDLQSWFAKIRGKEDPNSLIGFSGKKTKLNGKSSLALKNINLEFKQGEIIGLIGHNGAGKSTLLKILSRVTGPSKGKIKIKGRMASLLEVGTGFHPELTGRENVYLNASINGMQTNETKKKFEDILEFSGIGQYIDTPIKRYSSGMLVRLGFAVAAFLEPEILIVDEVLAVGDANFQKKAINKLNDYKNYHGKTVLIVSHNMELIKNLCARTVVLSKGEVVFDGNTENAVNHYLSVITKKENETGIREWQNKENAPGGDIIKLKSVCTKNNKNEISSVFNINEEITIENEFWVLKDEHQICNSIVFNYYSPKNLQREGSFYVLDNYSKKEWGKQKNFKKGVYKSVLRIPANLLNEGRYSLTVDPFIPPSDPDSSFQVRLHNAISFEVSDNFNKHETSRSNFPYDWQRGQTGYMIRPNLEFNTTKVN